MIYKEAVKSTEGRDIPLFTNGHPMHSKYNPKAAAVTFASSLKKGFSIIAGIGGGFHLQEALNLAEDSFFLCVEADSESLEFCRNLNGNRELEKLSNVFFTDISSLEKNLLELYNPTLYNSLSLNFWPSWANENPELSSRIQDAVNGTLKKIKADYSVQSWFGKQWHRNILLNSKLAYNQDFPSPDTDKTCLIAAAGPSLNSRMNDIKKDSASLYILSTDTSYQSLLASGIYPDAVISTDCQHISSEHFLTVHPAETKKTLFIFDLSSPVTAVKKIRSCGHEVFFVQSGHPLSSYLFSQDEVPMISTGNGTVTMAACTFALLAGFKKLSFAGCDFSYSGGKSYAGGTYLEKRFLSFSNRFENFETLYDAIMYRTPLYPQTKSPYAELSYSPKTSEVLDSYRLSLDEFISTYGFTRKKNEDDKKYVFETAFKCRKLNKALQSDYMNRFRDLNKKRDEHKQVFLPLTAFLRRLYPEKSFPELCSLAYTMSAEYI